MKLPPIIHGLLERERLRVVDIGARGGWPRKWRQLRPWVTFVGFEPDTNECERLRSLAGDDEIFIPRALYSTDTAITLYHTRDPRCSSVYPPDQHLIQRLRPGVCPGEERMDVLSSESIMATTLDNALFDADIQLVDFIKVDTQGSELDILRGGTRTLGRGVLGVEVEVEFLPLYKGQPLFPDVHEFMVSQGFALMDFPRVCSVSDFRAAIPSRRSALRRGAMALWSAAVPASDSAHRGAPQMLYADAIYLRDIDHLLNRMKHDEAEVELLATKVVAVCCATSYYQYALDLVNAAHADRLLDADMHRALRIMIRSFARSRFNMFRDAKRLAARVGHRLRHWGE